MKETFKNGTKTFSYLFDTTDYKRQETVLKYFLMIVMLPLHVFLFVVISVFFLIERLFAYVFRFFIAIQSFLFKKRAAQQRAFRKLFTLASVLVFIVFLPFLLVYYLSMLIKVIGKSLMKKVLFAMDFSNQLKPQEVHIFDDVSIHSQMKMSGMMKDLSNTEALGGAIQEILSQMEHLEDDPKKSKK